MRRQRLDKEAMRILPSLAVVAFGAGTLAFAAPSGAAPSGADTSSVSSGAIGASASISLFADPPVVSAPSPSVTLPTSGGSVSDAAPASSVHRSVAGAPFEGLFLDTGRLSVSSQGTAGPSGASTGAASAADVVALGGALTTLNLNSTCTSSAAGANGATTLTEGTLAISASETITLPSDPAPNTTFSGTSTGPGSGDTFTVVLNEQTSAPDSITVNAAHVILHGPSAVGDIIVAGSRCSSRADVASNPAPPTPAAPASPAAPVPPASVTPTPAAPATPSAPAAPATPSAPAAPNIPSSPAVRAPSTAAVAAPRAVGGDAGLGVRTAARTAAVPAAVPLAAAQGEGTGAYGFYSNVSIFGQVFEKGPMPTVTLPAAGADPALTDSAPSGSATAGPAKVFNATGELKVSTQGTATSSASSASVKGIGPDSSFTADLASSTCTGSGTGVSGSTTLANAKLVTKTDQSGEPAVTAPIPDQPAPNTELTGTLDNVGDSFRVVFNEQKASADFITVNAVHMFLLGPTAKGELVIGQSRCAKAAGAATGTGSTGTGSTGTGSTGTGSTGTGSTSTGSTGTGSTTTGGTGSASKARDPLAKTGFGVVGPLLLALTLLVLGLAASSGAARLRRRTVAGAPAPMPAPGRPSLRRRHLRPRRWGVCAMAILLAGCGGGEADKGTTAPTATASTGPVPSTAASSAPASTSPASADPAKEAKAKAAVLQLTDFPSGWKTQEEDAGLQLERLWQELSGCLGVQSQGKASAVATSPTFLRGIGTQARSTVEYLPAPASQAIITALGGAKLQGCATEAFQADVKRSAPEGGVPGPVTVAPLAFAKLGTTTLAWRATAVIDLDGLKIPITQDLIVVVKGEAFSRITFLNPGEPFPSDLQRSLAEKVVSRA